MTGLDGTAQGTVSVALDGPHAFNSLLFNFSSDRSNQSASASRAFATASSSESPADAQPGNSGNTAGHRPVIRWKSMTSLNSVPATVLPDLLQTFETPVGTNRAQFFRALRR